MWTITPEERDKYDKQFDTLSPSHGYVSGEQAHKFFLLSGLPAQVLTKIWALADLNKDGKMDRLEFSIAMKLIKLKLQGQNLPSTLPPVMKQSTPVPPAVPSAVPPAVPPTVPYPVPPAVPPAVPPTVPYPVPPAVPPAVPSPLLSSHKPPIANSFSSLPNGINGTEMTNPQARLGSGSSRSAILAPVSSNVPQAGSVDWAVPQPYQLKCQQYFSHLDTRKTGFLSGPQVRSALTASQLPPAQLANIWNLADVNKDGRLTAEEFILAMHLVDMAKMGLSLPLTLPVKLIPPSLRGVGSSGGSTPINRSNLSEKNEVTFEDKHKNFEVGEQMQALQLQRLQEEKERRERETREEVRRRQLEEESRLERQRELERLKAEEQRRQREKEEELRRQREKEEELRRQREKEEELRRQREKEEELRRQREKEEAVKQELERQRQRKLELELKRRKELESHRSRKLQDVTQLKAKKRSLDLALEAVGNKHAQISDYLLEVQNKKTSQKAELDLINRKSDRWVQEIGSLERQFKDLQKKLNQLVQQQQTQGETLRNIDLSNLPTSTMATLKRSVNEKETACRKLRELLEVLEKETNCKLSEMDQNTEVIKKLKESQKKKQSALDKLSAIRDEKLLELERRRKQDLEKRKREEEADRQAKLQEENCRILQEQREAALSQEAHPRDEDHGRNEEEHQEQLQREGCHREDKTPEQDDSERLRREELEREEESERQKELEREEDNLRQKELERVEENRRQKELEREEENRRQELQREEENRRQKELEREEENRREKELEREEENRREKELEREEENERQEKLKREENERQEKLKREEENLRQELQREEENRRQKELEREEENERQVKLKREEENRRQKELEREEENERQEKLKREEENLRQELLREEENRRQKELEREEENERQEKLKREEENERQEKLKREEENERQEKLKREEENERQEKLKREEENERQEKLKREEDERESDKCQQKKAKPKEEELLLAEKEQTCRSAEEGRKQGQCRPPDTVKSRQEEQERKCRAIVEELKKREESEAIVEAKRRPDIKEQRRELEGERKKKVEVTREEGSRLKRKEEASLAKLKDAGSKHRQPQTSAKKTIKLKMAALLKGIEERKGGKCEKSKGDVNVAALDTYRALYLFTARRTEELSFEADDLIEVDETREGEKGWLYGYLRGFEGWFPVSYAEKQLKPDTSLAGKEQLPPPVMTSISRYNMPEDEPSDLEVVQSFPADKGGPPTTTPEPASIGQGQAQALCSWEGNMESHLSFAKDSLIAVLDQQEEWWLGELNGTQGWFPKSLVKPLTPDGEQRDEPYPSVYGFHTLDSSHQEEYVALYTYESPNPGDLPFEEGDTILVTERGGDWWKGSIGDRTGVFPSNYVKPKEVNGCVKNLPEGQFHSPHVELLGPDVRRSTLAPVQNPVCQVVAIYDYTAGNQDEISFSSGQLINVHEKTGLDWWKGEINGVKGLFPTNYVEVTSDADTSRQCFADVGAMGPQEKKRQDYIQELIESEERHLEDLQLAHEVFYKLMSESGRLTEPELRVIFINWSDLIESSTKLIKALQKRRDECGERVPVQMIGDVLASELSDMQAYVVFCTSQLKGAGLLLRKTDQEPEFKEFLKKIATDYRCKGMPLTSFMLKPMQRVTKYPLIIKNILESTPEMHVDHVCLRRALEAAEKLCSQINEGVRQKENEECLEWLQSHVQCDGIIKNLAFNSLTNCLGPRKLLLSGKVHNKSKGNKEMYLFLFNDFLLLTYAIKQFSSSGADKLFSSKCNMQFKMYKMRRYLSFYRMHLTRPESQPLYEVCYYTSSGTLRHHLNATPRTSIQTALTHPYYYLQNEALRDETGALSSAVPDICIVYKLHLECGRLINLYDWLEAYCMVVTSADGADSDPSGNGKFDEIRRACFIRAVSELEFLGFIKSTKQKTDHVARLTWGGC